MADTSAILRPGETCREIARADRLAGIVDAADYFSYAKSALLQAEHRVILVGWDFDTRIRLDPRAEDSDVPDELGDLLSWLIKNRPGLEIFVLRWNIGAITGLARGMAPPFIQDLLTGRRLHYRIDAAHPVASAHHQKIAVIDDTFAFCGGIDMTVDRWDTSDHSSTNEFRVTPNGDEYGPWHDMTLALDGPAAGLIAEVAYDRWEAATGKRLPPVTADNDVWPEGLEPTFTDCVVGVARTIPEYKKQEEIDEIRQLYLAAIAAARDTIYIESQYLAARQIADALAERLAEPDGPEIVAVIPRHADGEIEKRAMDGARYKLLRMLWDADVHDRFRCYFPVTTDDEPIYVHAKVLIIDDTLFRVGSSNLNNRSLGFDSECDVALDVALNEDGADEMRATILAMRTRLLSEHLDISPEEFESALAEHDSLVAAIEAKAGSGKTLREFDRSRTADEDSLLAENDLIDPEEADPTRFERIYRVIVRRSTRGLRSLLPF